MSSEVKLRPALWRWVTEEGEPQQGTEQELVRQLSAGQVPPYALVWREGWGEWLPAMQVAELSAAFSHVAVLRQARPAFSPGDMPPVPVSEYPRLRLLAKESPLGVARGLECPERDVITAEVPVAALLEAVRVMTEPSPPADLGLEAAIRGRDSERPPPSRPAPPLAAEFGLQALLEPELARGPRWVRWLRSQAAWVALGAVTLGLSALFAARWLAASRPSAPAPSDVAALTPAAAAERQSVALEPPLPGCALASEPVKLDSWAVVDVRPSLAALPSSRSVLLGYAQSHKHATGGRLDPAALQFQRTFGQQEEGQIFSVTPLVARGSPGYHVERMGALVAFGRALDTSPPLRVGMNDAGLVLGALDARSTRAWELPPRTLISVPEVAEHERGFTLAFRAGRTSGPLRVGLLDHQGKPLSELEQIGTADSEYGRPALASGARQNALAASLRRGPDGPYDLMIGRAESGRLPLELSRLELPDLDALEPTAPALAALPDGSFALMWTQGDGWRRRVRLVRLSSVLTPAAEPIDVSTPDPALGGATAGALFWASDRLLAFYFLRREEGHSLWAVSLSCPASGRSSVAEAGGRPSNVPASVTVPGR